MKTDKKSCYLKNSKRDAMKNKEKNQAQSSNIAIVLVLRRMMDKICSHNKNIHDVRT